MKLEELKGIGPKTIQILNKINIECIEDLLTFYPYRYNYIYIKNLNECQTDQTIYLKAAVASTPKVMYIKRNFNFLTFNAISDNQVINVKIFNRAFLKNNLSLNKNIILVGKYDPIKNLFTASDIKFNLEQNTIEPVYHLKEGLKNSSIAKLITSALSTKFSIDDHIPQEYVDKYHFINKDLALKQIHMPSTINEIEDARQRLVYEELFEYMFKINSLKAYNAKQNGIQRKYEENKVEDFLASIPFKLTEDQLRTINEILADLKNEKRMNRLVLGDVGSGKTIVAMIAILANYYSGYQSTFMAPTEILAKQHYETMLNFFDGTGMNIALLTGSIKKKDKEKLYEKVINNEIDLLIGTHALINNDLAFQKLGLVITDEQHLFGVKQRNDLQNKGVDFQPDCLYLSATPIPRTYALTIYGDLSLSIIKTKPKLRKEIITKVKKETEIKDVLRAMYEELKNKHQIFVVSPLIEQNETSDLNSVYLLQEKLNTAFNNQVQIGIIHGKLKQKEKDEIMNDFAEGKIKILISTTVIEVGIDIPNATMMVIYNAERFGLAALHQLRGRVGRSDLQSYCYLISNSDNERLKVMEESSDGFYISEKDFEQRGQGDLFGYKQSGEMIFKIADIKKDSQVLLQTNHDAEEFLTRNLYTKYPYYQNIYNELGFLD